MEEKETRIPNEKNSAIYQQKACDRKRLGIRTFNMQLLKYQYFILAFLAKNELTIEICFTKIIFLVIKICLMSLFCHFFMIKLGQMFVLKLYFLPDFCLMRILILKYYSFVVLFYRLCFFATTVTECIYN